MGESDPGNGIRSKPMSEPSIQARVDSRWAAVLWMVIGALALLLSRGIRQPGFATNQDPGPAFFPILLGSLLLLAGLWRLILSIRAGKTSQHSETHSESTSKGMAGQGNFWKWFPSLLIYPVLMPQVGFILSSALFAAWMLWVQGSRWWVAILVAAALAMTIQGLFGQVFHLQFPPGHFLSLP